MSPIALITTNVAFERRARAALDGVGDDVLRRWRKEFIRIDPTKVVAEVADAGCDVACLGPNLEEDFLLDLADAFDREHPEIFVMLVAESSPELLDRALRAGVRGVLSPDVDHDELARAFARASDTAARRRAVMQPEAEPAGSSSRIITVVSPKGGSGKTTVATNLAVGLAHAAHGEVAIVDLDVLFGDVASALQLDPVHTLGDVVTSPETLDATMLKVFLSAHPSGLYAMCAPDSPAEGDDVTFEHSARVVRLLSAEFPYVVVDTAAGLDEQTLAAAEQATDLVLLCTMDVASVRSLRKELDALDRLGFTSARRHFVLNRADAKVGLDVADVESVLEMKVDVALPGSRAVPFTMNQGTTLLESDPRSPVAKQLQVLVDRFTERRPVTSAPHGSGSLLRRLRDPR